jgi:uncharacterized protein (DUF1015 family)
LVVRLLAQSPYNIARIVVAPAGGGPDPTGDHYRRASELLQAWVSQSALTSDTGPAVYPYSQTYTVGGRRMTRRGFIALGDVRDAGLFTHEETHSHVREDRAQLRLATSSDFGLIFMIYSDTAQAIDRILRDCEDGEPIAQSEQPDGSVHRLYRCGDPQRVARILEIMEKKECVIADGHHRTAAARQTWEEKRDERWAGAMMAFFNADAPGMTVLPIHRVITNVSRLGIDEVIEKIAEYFDVALIPMPDVPYDERASFLLGLVTERARHDRVAFAMVGSPTEIGFLIEAGRSQMSTWPWPSAMPEACRTLPTAVFETGVLRAALDFSDEDIDHSARIEYPKDAGSVLEVVRRGRAQLGFLLPPTPLDAIFELARLRQNLPRKSTFFFPKLLTGLTVHRIEAGPTD